MAFELFNFSNNPITFGDLDNKAFWCSHGEKQEEAFIKMFAQLQQQGRIISDEKLAIHPSKELNPYHPDLIINNQFIGEVKTKNSPLFMAQTYGINPQFALTMDLKDSFNYGRLLKNGIDITIYIWVKWEAMMMKTKYNQYRVKQLAGVWRTSFSTLREHELKSPPPIHWYKESFRKPPTYLISDEQHSRWSNELISFEPRLIENSGQHIRNITSKGYTNNKEQLYTSGHSYCSYVFDLSNTDVFTELYSNIMR
jgi:hypothetical protein